MSFTNELVGEHSNKTKTGSTRKQMNFSTRLGAEVGYQLVIKLATLEGLFVIIQHDFSVGPLLTAVN